ncbi:PREDICTED: formin-like protein 2 [Rhagoletis zephyria]|uniref:formin-like protein 2 n=1 Tax=Rhagoletis zephyria TaxID=28612 RepID=UPI0008112C51|nr:PREDICTED: formin-like protein 2 [Rhagoletis zephyria]
MDVATLRVDKVTITQDDWLYSMHIQDDSIKQLFEKLENKDKVRLPPKPRKRRLAWEEDGEVDILDVQVKLANFTQRYRKEKLAMGPSGGSPSTWPLYARVHQIIGGFKANMFCELTLENISESDIASQPSPLTPILPSSLSPTFSSPLASPLPAVPTTPLPTPSPPLSSPLTPLPTTPLPTPSPPLSSPSSPMPSSSASAVEPKRRKVIGTLQKKVLDKFDGLSAEISQHIQRSEENEKEWMKIEKDKADTLREIANDNKELKVGILSFLNRN